MDLYVVSLNVVRNNYFKSCYLYFLTNKCYSAFHCNAIAMNNALIATLIKCTFNKFTLNYIPILLLALVCLPLYKRR